MPFFKMILAILREVLISLRLMLGVIDVIAVFALVLQSIVGLITDTKRLVRFPFATLSALFHATDGIHCAVVCGNKIDAMYWRE